MVYKLTVDERAAFVRRLQRAPPTHTPARITTPGAPIKTSRPDRCQRLVNGPPVGGAPLTAAADEAQRIARLERDLDDLRRATTHFERIAAVLKLVNDTRVLEHQVIGDARNHGVTWQAIREIHNLSVGPIADRSQCGQQCQTLPRTPDHDSDKPDPHPQ